MRKKKKFNKKEEKPHSLKKEGATLSATEQEGREEKNQGKGRVVFSTRKRGFLFSAKKKKRSRGTGREKRKKRLRYVFKGGKEEEGLEGLQTEEKERTKNGNTIMPCRQ